MSTPENKVKNKIDRVLTKHGVYWFKPVQMGFGAVGLDYHCIVRGLAFCIEAKAPGKKPTPRQESTIATIRSAGAPVFVIDGDCGLLDAWLADVV